MKRLAKLSAQRMTKLRNTGTSTDPLLLAHTREPGELSPASPTQEQQWFLDRLGTGEAAAYLVPFALRLRGPLDIDALRTALHGVLAAHDVLRSRFTLVDGNLRQQPDPLGEPALPVIPVADEDSLWQQAHHLAAQPFDLTRAPLVRSTLLRHDPEDHTLVWIAHHAVADGWSVQVLIDELAARYRAAIGLAPEVAPGPLQYADIAQWQRQRLTGTRQADLIDFWRQHIGAAPPAVLPPDHPRPATPSFAGDHLTFTLPTEVAAAVTELAMTNRTTTFVVLLATLQAVLARYNGETDAVIGAAVTGRWRAEMDRVIGPFATTVPLRVDAGGDPTFADLVDRVAGVVLDGLAHQELPFAHLVRAVGQARDAGRNPLYQVLFSMDPLVADDRVDVAPGLTMTQTGLPNHTARLDLQLTMAAGQDVLRGRLDYRTDLYDKASITAFANTYTTALTELTTNAHQPISAIALLNPDTRNKTLNSWQHINPKPILGVLDQITARTAASPDHPALRFGFRQWTYRELDEWSNRYAHTITAHGGGPGILVAVAIERTPELLPVLLGVLKSGATYLPLDPTAPPDRLTHLLNDSGAQLLIHDPEAPQHTDLASLPTNDPAIAAAPTHTPPNSPAPTDIAYAMYTSGSTGLPKGVLIEHRSLGNFLAAMADHGLVTEQDRVLALTNITFDISFDELLLPLTVGAEVVLADRETTRSGPALRALIESAEVTVLHGTPAMCRMLVDAGWTGSPVRRVLCGGEAMSARLAGELTSRVPEVWNLFGPTEATVWSLVHRVDGAGAPPIGSPLANTTALVLDPVMRPVPPGVRGELFLGGVGVAHGYLNRPELTAERFVTGPDGARLYRTGDVCSYDTAGLFHFHGRSDHQVKLRGFRIELGEVEAALTALPEVAEAVAAVWRRSDDDHRLVAYLCCAEPVSDEDLRAATARTLPEHMVPSHWIRLDALPLTPAGKIDRIALARLPIATGRAADRPLEPPSTATERVLAEQVRSLLEDREIGVTDNFFTNGGHSLLVIRLLATVHDLYDVDVPIQTFFQNPTVRGLATAIESLLRTDDPLLERIEQMSDEEVARLLEDAV